MVAHVHTSYRSIYVTSRVPSHITSYHFCSDGNLFSSIAAPDICKNGQMFVLRLRLSEHVQSTLGPNKINLLFIDIELSMSRALTVPLSLYVQIGRQIAKLNGRIFPTYSK